LLIATQSFESHPRDADRARDADHDIDRDDLLVVHSKPHLTPAIFFFFFLFYRQPRPPSSAISTPPPSA
jgi:hypothetical protein